MPRSQASDFFPASGRALTPASHCLPTKNDAQRRSAEIDVVDYAGGIKIPFEVPIHECQIPHLASPEPDARRCLPGELRLAGTNIKVVRQKPPFSQCRMALQTNNSIQGAKGVRDCSRLAGTQRLQLQEQTRIEIQIARTADQIKVWSCLPSTGCNHPQIAESIPADRGLSR